MKLEDHIILVAMVNLCEDFVTREAVGPITAEDVDFIASLHNLPEEELQKAALAVLRKYLTIAKESHESA